MHLALRLLVTATIVLLAFPVQAQFQQTEAPTATTLANRVTQKIQIGMTITAKGGPCRGIVATAPVPMEWPEQQVQIVDEDVTPNAKVQYRVLQDGVKQMVVHVPVLAPNEQARALITFEVSVAAQLPPSDPSVYSIPKRVPRDIGIFLGTSPYIESRNPKIENLAKEIGRELEGWAKVEALYDLAREKVEYKEGDLKSALTALNDGQADCEGMSLLFIALCRAEDIPARTVWVEGHCYPEFYLVDQEGKGFWFPCQAAGTRAFGGMPDPRVILQKGDNIRDPDRPKEKLHYVSEFARGAAVRGGGKPHIDFVRKLVQ